MFFQICVKECPKNQFLLDTVTNYNPSDMLCVNGVPTPRTKQEAMQMVREGKCAQWYLPSESGEYCSYSFFCIQ